MNKVWLSGSLRKEGLDVVPTATVVVVWLVVGFGSGILYRIVST